MCSYFMQFVAQISTLSYRFMSLDRTMHSVLLDSTWQGNVSRRFSDFLMSSSFFISNNCSAACLQKTGGFARNWPLSRAKFAAVFLLHFKVLHPSGGSFEKSSCAKNLL
jgi:hypothetical protein